MIILKVSMAQALHVSKYQGEAVSLYFIVQVTGDWTITTAIGAPRVERELFKASEHHASEAGTRHLFQTIGTVGTIVL